MGRGYQSLKLCLFYPFFNLRNLFYLIRTLVAYTYNGDDLRTAKTVRSSDKGYQPETVAFLYDRQHVILGNYSKWSLKVCYVRGINLIKLYLQYTLALSIKKKIRVLEKALLEGDMERYESKH